MRPRNATSAESACTGTSRITPAEAFAAAARAQRAGHWDLAASAYRQALALKPDLMEAHHNLGLVLRAMGRLDDAATAFDAALTLRPDLLETHVSLGLIRRDQSRLDEAAACFERALALRPRHPGAWMNLANIQHLRGDFVLSIETYRQILTVHPTYPDAHMNLGVVLKEQGDSDGAEACFRRALTLRPDYPAALHGLGGVLADSGRGDQAIDAYRRAVAHQPDFAEAHASLGAACQAQGRLDAAEAAFRAVAALRPNSAVAHMNLAKALQSQGRLAGAIASLDRVLAIEPGHREAADARLCALSYQPDVSAEQLLDQHQRWGKRQPSDRTPAFDGARDASRRLRIGYVSGDFHRHPVGFFIGPVLAAHDRSVVEVFCYSNGGDDDETTARLRDSADHWREIAELDDEAATDLIRADQIDILVDLSGHTPGNRLDLFARRPAPVQASWLGYAATTGLPQIDYLVMDPTTAPPEARDWCTEALARLPKGRFCYGPPDAAPDPAPAPSIARGFVTFGSFNNLVKINRQVAELWARMVATTPGSRLVLKWAALNDPGVRRRTSEMFQSAGVPAEALELRGFSLHPAMLAEYADIDVALDPFPFGGGLTSCEALWMGVPVVTRPGDRFASRQTLGFLRGVGLDDLAADSADAYVAVAAALAADVERRAALRASLRARMAGSPLCDAGAFTSDLEAAYREMWRCWCEGEAPAAFDIMSPGA